MHRIKYIFILIILVILIQRVYSYNVNVKLRLLNSTCLNIVKGESKSEVDSKLYRFYTKNLGIVDDYKKIYYGMTKFDFDPFCLVTYDKNDKVSSVGFSYD